ncbi:MAG: LysM peptidoglycan-binding domain-containing protein [Bacteroidota bacterium]
MKFNRLVIKGYADPECKKSPIGDFNCRINPDSFVHNHKIKLEKRRTSAKGSPGSPSNFVSLESEVISFDILLDGTGVIPGNDDVLADIKQLKRTMFYFNGEIHRPSYLKLVWGPNFQRMKGGPQFFRCQLVKLDISFSLFKPDGTPLRAKASVSFEEFRTQEEIEKSAKKSSPDMTHVKVVRQGDTIPMLCHSVYNDSSYYLQIAHVNNLTNFRKIVPGQELIFPPVKALLGEDAGERV